MSDHAPSLDEIRAWHQAEADGISDCIRRGDTDHLRISTGAFAKEFANLTEEDFRKHAKDRLRELNKKHANRSLEP